MLFILDEAEGKVNTIIPEQEQKYKQNRNKKIVKYDKNNKTGTKKEQKRLTLGSKVWFNSVRAIKHLSICLTKCQRDHGTKTEE